MYFVGARGVFCKLEDYGIEVESSTLGDNADTDNIDVHSQSG